MNPPNLTIANQPREEDKSETVAFSELPAGRYEFKDSGIYIGEWLHEKANGIGLLTKDKSQGEYTGYWNGGSEKHGVFLWPSAPGAMYEGDWSNSKRHGYGKFVKEDWIIMGKFCEGFITIGVKTREDSLGKFEGEFEDGCPKFGRETYVDGSNYYGELDKGVRQGYGVRISLPYEDIFSQLPESKKKGLYSLSKKTELTNGLTNGHDEYASLEEDNKKYYPNVFNCGFVLKSTRSDQLMKKLRHISGCKKHLKRSSLNQITNGTIKKRGKLKKSKSLTSVFSAINKKDLYSTDFICPPDRMSNIDDYVLRSHRDVLNERDFFGASMGNLSHKSNYTSLTFQTVTTVTKDKVDQMAGLEMIRGDVKEVYSGEWVQDNRSGHGIALRTDGVVYEGSWFQNRRHGYGITKFGDGTFEEGFYQNDKLVRLWFRTRNPFVALNSLRMTYSIKKNVMLAREAAKKAQDKMKSCTQKLSEIQDIIRQTQQAANIARGYSLETRQLVKDMYPEFEQPGIKCLKDIVRNMKVTKRGQIAFETMLQEAMDVIEGKGIPLIKSEPLPNSMQDEKGPNDQPNSSNDNYSKPILMVDQQGRTRASRHGSFRRAMRVQSQDVAAADHIESPKRISKVESKPINPRDRTRLESTITPSRGSNLRSSPRGLKNSRLSVEESISIGSGSVRKQGSPNRLGVDNNSQHKLQNGILENDEEDEDGEFVRVDCIVATSEIPVIPLSKMLTQESITDHFNHYDDPYSSIKTHSLSVGTNGSINDNTDPTDDVNKRNVPNRRSTVPDIMSQPPVAPRPVSSTLCDCQEEPEDEEEQNLDPDTMFVIDNGVRKRVSPITPLEEIRANRRRALANKYSNESSSNNKTKQSYVGIEDADSDSRMTLSPPQDHLSPLPVIFQFQNQVNLRKDLKEGSLPDVSATRLRSGMPREEVLKLTEEHRQAVALDQAKRKQGMIVIRLQRIKDFISKNFVVLTVLLFNVIFISLLISMSFEAKKV